MPQASLSVAQLVMSSPVVVVLKVQAMAQGLVAYTNTLNPVLSVAVTAELVDLLVVLLV